MKNIPKFLSLLTALVLLVTANAWAAEPKEIIGKYLEVQTALAGDDLAAAQTSAKSLETASSGESTKDLQAAAGKVAAAADLAAARIAFELLSEKTITLAKANKGAAGKDLYVANCPMALGDGADWLQDSRKIANPYYGASMLGCGTVKETLTQK